MEQNVKFAWSILNKHLFIQISFDYFMAQSIQKEDVLALKKFGLNVPQNQIEEVLKQIRMSSSLREEFEKIRNSLATMLDQNLFLDTINASHQKISQIPQNSKVIQIRDGTYVIRAINPQQIESLTQRAFFNSFSLERIMLKDIQCQQIKKVAQMAEQKRSKPQTSLKDEIYDSEKCFCICGKNKDKQVAWIQCANEGKCRGSSWYHLECSGLGDVSPQDLESLNYICMHCKRGGEESNPSSDGYKKIKKN